MIRHEKRRLTLCLSGETPITLAQVPNYIPKRNGRKTHYSTVFRWATKGARGRILETTLVGGIRYTTVEAVERFLNSTTPSPLFPQVNITAVEHALDQAGL